MCDADNTGSKKAHESLEILFFEWLEYKLKVRSPQKRISPIICPIWPQLSVCRPLYVRLGVYS